MMSDEQKSVLIVDDQEDFAKLLQFRLEQEEYRVEIVDSVSNAIDVIQKGEAPTFILADRMLEGEPIERRQLKRLSAEADDSQIIVYTAADELTKEQEYTILDKGAVRVLSKQVVDMMVDDIRLLTQELDELISISDELQSLTSERSKLAAALVGSHVGVSVIDRHYRCWFANAAMENIVGQTCSEKLCWRLFHSYPVSCGPCWGCSIKEVVESNTSVDRLLFSRFADEAGKWVSVRSIPIRSDETDEIIAVRVGITTDTDALVRSLTFEQRLKQIARGLIHIGFGRVRIHKVEAEHHVILSAATNQTDNPQDPESKYESDLRDVTLDYNKECPYTSEAEESDLGLLVSDWDAHGPSPFADELDLEPPYFIVPIRYGDGKLWGYLSVDFVGIEAGLQKNIIKRYANEQTLGWLQNDYAAEIREALEAEEVPGQRDLYQTVQKQRSTSGQPDRLVAP